MGELKRTMMKIQLADCSLISPYGLVKDIIVKVDNVMIPTDFIICEMEEDKEVPLILGRPFLRTGRALIDVHGGELTLRVNDKEVKFNVHKAMKYPKEESCCAINAVDALVRVLGPEEKIDIEKELEYVKFVDGSPMHTFQPAFEPLEGMEIEKDEPSLEEPQLVELTSLPPDLFQVEFIRSTNTSSDFMCADFKGNPEEEPRVWKKQKIGIVQEEAFFLDDSFEPYIPPQRRLQLSMMEVDRKEIIK